MLRSVVEINDKKKGIKQHLQTVKQQSSGNLTLNKGLF